jgi:hypothetical protein
MVTGSTHFTLHSNVLVPEFMILNDAFENVFRILWPCYLTNPDGVNGSL